MSDAPDASAGFSAGASTLPQDHSPQEVSHPRLQIFPVVVQKYVPVAVFYFLLNSAGLPRGLFYCTLLSPLFYLWLLARGRRWITTQFLLVLSPFFVAHLVMGVSSLAYYARSVALLWTAYVTTYALWLGLRTSRRVVGIFESVIVCNFAAACLAVVLLFTPARDVLWHDDSGTVSGAGHFHRLSMLSTEPSVYALLMLPLLIFTALRLILRFSVRNLLYFLAVLFPFLLCQSFGGISMAVAAILAALVVSNPKVFLRPSTLAAMALLAAIAAAALLIQNPISARLLQVLNGSDSSTNSRTLFSFIVGYTLAVSKSIWWGVGFGQGKLQDVSGLGIGFDVGVIPNAIAGMLAETGLVGVTLRLAVEIVLFFRTRVYRNSFQTAMFVVAFLTQLTGSYTANVQELLIWCMAFSCLLPEMNSRLASATSAQNAPQLEGVP